MQLAAQADHRPGSPVSKVNPSQKLKARPTNSGEAKPVVPHGIPERHTYRDGAGGRMIW